MIKGLTMINPHDCRYVKERLTPLVRQDGIQYPIMAFSSVRICLMDYFAVRFRLFDDAYILKLRKFANNV